MYPFYVWWDPTYILVVIGAVLCIFASMHVNHAFAKYSRIQSMSGMTGAQAAQRILNRAGIYDVKITHVAGKLTDHYSPSEKVLRLSDSVYQSTSVAAVGVAAHECGHAIQHQKNYAPLRLRDGLVPVTNIASTLSWPLILIGLLFSKGMMWIYVGILLFSFAVLFQLVTLPVEFNASRRALVMLEETGILGHTELKMTRKVLKAAALTYVAGAASTILQLLRLILLFGGNRDND